MKPIRLKDQLKTARSTIRALSEVAQLASPSIAVRDVFEVTRADGNDKDLRDLENLFNEYGSDESGKHNYHLIYSWVLRGKRHLPLTILEIGLGTNYLDTLSNMGLHGRPGASLRAFRTGRRTASFSAPTSIGGYCSPKKNRNLLRGPDGYPRRCGRWRIGFRRAVSISS